MAREIESALKNEMSCHGGFRMAKLKVNKEIMVSPTTEEKSKEKSLAVAGDITSWPFFFVFF